MTYKETTWEAPAVAPAVTVEQVLARAADLIEEHGWIQRLAHSADGYCALGAIDAAVGDLGAGQLSEEAIDRLAKRIYRPLPPPDLIGDAAVWGWNDTLHPRRGRRKVLKALRSA